MQPNDTFASGAKSASITRYLVPLALLVAIIGGVAWVVQYLPRWRSQAPVTSRTRSAELLKFHFDRAIWDKTATHPFREFEPGDKGHYDFLFKNVFGHDIELVHYSSTCDCTSVTACALPIDEVERLEKAQAQDPGAALPYQAEPKWIDLPNGPQQLVHLKVKADEGGVVRVRWNARKAPGQSLNVRPEIWAQPDGDSRGRKSFPLQVPAMMTAAVRILPVRVNVGVLTAGATAKAEFDAWSATRDDFKLALNSPGPDPFFVVTMKPLSKDEGGKLERFLNSNKQPTRVKSGYHVTITVHENVAGQQLDLGVFYRKFALVLDGAVLPDVPGPEVAGRVQGDLVVGGADDQGKIRFRSFEAATGATKTVELLAAADAKLETHFHQPSWLKLRLLPEQKLIDGNKRMWRLEVTVPPKTPGARSLDEPDAVVLRIAGPPPRLVRIPIEGHISGR